MYNALLLLIHFNCHIMLIILNCCSTGYFVGVERFCVGSFCFTETGFQTQIDSGTSFTYLPNGVYKKVVAEVICFYHNVMVYDHA